MEEKNKRKKKKEKKYDRKYEKNYRITKNQLRIKNENLFLK